MSSPKDRTPEEKLPLPPQTPVAPAPAIPEILVPILKDFAPALERQQQECQEKWHKVQRNVLTTLRKHLKELHQKVEAIPLEGSQLKLIWEYGTAFCELERKFLDQTTYLSPEQPFTEVLQDWNPLQHPLLDEIPERVQHPEDPGEWQITASDSRRVQLWKKARKWRFGLVTTRRRSGNQLRKRFKKAEIPPVQFYRTVALRAFARHFLYQPAAAFLFEEWNQYLQLVARQRDLLYPKMREIFHAALFLQDAEKVWIHGEVSHREELLAVLDGFGQLLNECRSALDAFAEERRGARQDWYAQTVAAFADQWFLAGTWLLPNQAFRPAATEKKQAALEQKYLQHRQKWHAYFEVEKADWHGDFTLIAIQLNTGQNFLKATTDIRERIENLLLPTFSNTIAALEEVAGAFDTTEIPPAEGLRKKIISESHNLLKRLRNQLLPEMANAFLKARFNQIINRYLYETRQCVNQISDKHVILTKKSLDVIPPRVVVEDIPMRELFQRELLHHLEEKANAYDNEFQHQFTVLMNNLMELDQVAEINLKVALDILKEKEDPGEALKQAHEGMERAAERLAEHVEKCRALEDQSANRLYEMAHSFIEQVQELLDNEKLRELKLKLVRAKTREKIRQTRQQLWSTLKRALPLLVRYLTAGVQYIYKQYQRLGILTGLLSAPRASQEELFQYLAETNQKISALPYIYQHLFNVEPLDDDRLFAGRDQELSMLKEDFANWQNGRFMSTMLVGERGSGRTSLLNFARKDIYRGIPVNIINLEETLVLGDERFLDLLRTTFSLSGVTTMDEAEQKLIELDPPQVCIVENIQNLFLRTVNGFDLMKRFLRLIYHTQKKVFWVLTCTQYSWNYLDKVIGIGQHFQRVLTLTSLRQEDLEKIIMKRHRITGYQLEFEIPQEVKRNRTFRKLKSYEEQQVYLKDHYFKDLYELAQGNIAVLLLYWQRSVSAIKDNKLILSPRVDFDYSFIYQLSAEELFTLGALLQHEMLTIEEHATIFHQSEEASDLLFSALARKGIILEGPGGYRVHPFLYRPAVRALKNIRILH